MRKSLAVPSFVFDFKERKSMQTSIFYGKLTSKMNKLKHFI